MKKILNILVMASVMVACNNATENNTPETVTSTADTVDQRLPPPPPPISIDTPSTQTDSTRARKAMKK